MNRKLDWETEGRDWPNRAASRFVNSGDLRWHVQVMGDGPALVLLHGTGAATHSWRTLAPLLAQTHTVVAPDLPGHGFTSAPHDGAGFTLPAVAQAVSALLAALDIAPLAMIGHSAGAAIGARMLLDGALAPSGLIGLNAALLPFPGPLGPWAPTLARLFFYNPFSLGLFAQRAAHPGAIASLMRSTGSTLDAEGLGLYERLFRNKAHLEGTVALMAHWDLYALKRDLVHLRVPLTLIAGDADRAVSPDTAFEVQRLAQHAHVIVAPGLGHLAHEENPALIAEMIQSALQHGR
ncbi:MAG: alpha/beta fold hydrolase BchO [Hyphomonadaceae bacterium]